MKNATFPPATGPKSLEGTDPYIPIREFKDKFLPSLNWKKDTLEFDPAAMKK